MSFHSSQELGFLLRFFLAFSQYVVDNDWSQRWKHKAKQRQEHKGKQIFVMISTQNCE